jgi:hypothetical protein
MHYLSTFIIRIYHDTWSCECQILILVSWLVICVNIRFASYHDLTPQMVTYYALNDM